MTSINTQYCDTSTEEAQMQAWITAITARDEQALAQLYEATLSRVYGLALGITHNPQAAEEVSEDVYWQVWRKAPRFDSQRGNVIAWLLTITRSRALDYLRKEDSALPRSSIAQEVGFAL